MKLSGVLPVIPTPFLDGEVDYASFNRMLEFCNPGVDGYTILGSTGEATSMSLKERMELVERAMCVVPRGEMVIVGIAQTEVAAAIELARHAEAHGVRACLIPSPYYFTNTKRGVYEYLRAIDSQVGIDLVFYDNPYTTKTFWSATDLAELAGRLDHLCAVKVTDHEIAKISWLKQHTDLAVFAGDDVVLYRSLLMGADGCMVIAPAVCPRAFRDSWRLLRSGCPDESYRLFSKKVLPFLHMFGVGSEIAATKALYKHLGIFTSDEVRPPLERCDDTWRDQLVLAYETCEAL